MAGLLFNYTNFMQNIIITRRCTVARSFKNFCYTQVVETGSNKVLSELMRHWEFLKLDKHVTAQALLKTDRQTER